MLVISALGKPGGSRVQDQPQLKSKLEAILGYRRPVKQQEENNNKVEFAQQSQSVGQHKAF